ncbi:uncharacterized protein LOC107021651 isoform X4 [Solanum pennellii]|uniref:Uncharacterized protein LOC107021651 isoform X4 n=1 Tax=Solanum pennellii TaxID=28526 RepID=A0ABM1GYR5_SOLPN|nr:uncharacterized protein LOC107021651 isoform X4 [Solanum pennellii]
MLIFHRIIYSNTWQSPCSLLSIIRRLRCQFSFSNCLSKCYIDEECNDFLLWLEHKAGVEISSLLSIGKFANGRSLVARHPIKPGDCLLRVPYNVQLAPDNLPRGINALLGDNVGNVAKVALLILYEQKLGKKSEWDPYISRLPRPEDMHNTASFQFSGIIQDVTLENFKYACALVTSRAWESSRGVSMIPFADFANHSDLSDTTVLCSEKKQLSEVIADYSYAPGDQVLIRYGNFSNARLLLDFGFTLPCNMYDQVEVELTIPHEDKLRQLKLKLLSKHQIPILKDVNGFSSSEYSSALKEVRFADAQGRGIPQSIRAFARVLCSNSPQEINYLAMEAAENDGRVARRPLKDKSREIQAHQFLLSKITGLIDEYNASIKSLELPTLCLVGKLDMRRQMAQYLLTGELRVLKSAALWLENYCKT